MILGNHRPFRAVRMSTIAVATTGRARACHQLNLECRQSNPFTAIKLNESESQNSPPVRDV